uniref:Uncharacterized protein n=1 Tax=Strigamia maritima TaxID=126957 RepID=T1JHI4_STRMM
MSFLGYYKWNGRKSDEKRGKKKLLNKHPLVRSCGDKSRRVLSGKRFFLKNIERLHLTFKVVKTSRQQYDKKARSNREFARLLLIETNRAERGKVQVEFSMVAITTFTVIQLVVLSVLVGTILATPGERPGMK